MKQINISKINRVIGMLEGLSFGVNDDIGAALGSVSDMLEEVLKDEVSVGEVKSLSQREADAAREKVTSERNPKRTEV